jgi:DNA-directed RNA polymerase I, II, and III subunit RPABC2
MSDIDIDDDGYSTSSDSSSELEEKNLDFNLRKNDKNFNKVSSSASFIYDEGLGLNESDDETIEGSDVEDDKNEKNITGDGVDDADEEFNDIGYNSNDEDVEYDEKDDDDDEFESDLHDDEIEIKKQIGGNKNSNTNIKINIDSQNTYNQSDSDSDNEDENYLQKFSSEINKNYVMEFHPECMNHNYDEITALSKVTRDEFNIIIDPLHKTIPFLTKYEKTRILGQRAKQIECGAKPLVRVPENIIDGYIIAELELQQKKIPFIIRRPLPNGGSEYWNLKDLEMITF